MTDGLIEIGQAIGGFSALLAAIVAAIAVWITYKLRSLKMRSTELHSEQLKQTIQDWLNEFKHPDLPAKPALIPKTQGRIELIPEPQLYSLSIEADILFQDLPNHLPRSLFSKWNQYKSRHNAYLSEKQQLTQCVLAFAIEVTRLEIYDGSGALPEKNVLFHNVIPLLLADLDAISESGQPRWFDWAPADSDTDLRFENGTLFRGDQGIIYCAVEAQAYEFYAQLSKALSARQATGLVEGVREHRSHFEGLKHLREDITSDLQEWLKVPILPKECKLLKKGAR